MSRILGIIDINFLSKKGIIDINGFLNEKASYAFVFFVVQQSSSYVFLVK